MKCQNCGSASYVRPRYLFEEVPKNSIPLCRRCDIRLELGKLSPSEGNRSPVSFWISEPLYKGIRSSLGKSSLSTVARVLIKKFVEDPTRFSDLSFYQDKSGEVKINFLVDRTVYERFKEICRDKGMTATDAIRSLLTLYLDMVQEA